MIVENARRRIAQTVNRMVAGADERPFLEHDTNDPGPIPLDSPAREVLADASGFIGGVRALLYQCLNPDAVYAVHQHSNYEDDPLGRLQRTGYFLGATVFGSGREAEQAIAVVRSIHKRITGTLPDGRSYRADDPHLLGWVHATEVDSFLAGFQKYGPRRLDDAEADRYVADMAVIGEALGAVDMPRNQTELADMLAMYRKESRSTPECRDITRFIFAPQLPLTALPFYPVIFSAAVASLPYWERAELMLPVVPLADPLVIRPAATALIKLLRWSGDPMPMDAAH